MKNNISGYIEDNNNRIYMTDKELMEESMDTMYPYYAVASRCQWSDHKGACL